MTNEVVLIRGPEVTMRTFMRFYFQMNSLNMKGENTLGDKSLIALLTFKWFLFRVNSSVFDEVWFRQECLITVLTYLSFISFVCLFMAGDICLSFKLLRTVFTFERSLITV